MHGDATAGTGSFGERLRELRERAGLTQEALAEKSGLSRDAVSALERGKRTRPHPITITSLADALGLDAFAREQLRESGRNEPSVSAPAPVHDIPTPPYPLLGRETEVATVLDLLIDQGERLVTLTGPGGVGKTRMAIEIGASSNSGFAGGTVFVPLAAIQDSGLVRSAVLNATGLRASSQAQVAEPAPLLVILDNLEHLPNVATVVAELIQDFPQMSILVTSRSSLRLRGEREIPIRPFPVAAGSGDIHDPAVALFLDRARAVHPAFAPTPTQLVEIGDVCRLLDGLPLAIELAAARIKVLAPDALRDRLGRNLDLLSGGPRDLDARQQNIRATIQWSYDLLEPDERTAFRALAVFQGGFTLAAAEAVLADSHGFDAFTTLELVSSLIDKNLIRTASVDGAEPRYAMLFIIRSFGFAELEASADSESIHRGFVRWVQALTDRAARVFRDGGAEEQWHHFAEMERERGNWRAALRWLNEHGPASDLHALATRLGWFWYVRGPITEGQFWLGRALANRSVAPEILQPTLMAAGMLQHFGGDNEAAIDLLRESLNTPVAEPDQWWIGCSQMLLGMSYLVQGATIPAEPAFAAGVEAFQSIGHTTNAAICLNYLGAIAWHRGNLTEAQAICSEALRLHRERGNPWGVAASLEYLGLIAGDFGDVRTSANNLVEALDLRIQAAQVGGHPAWDAGAWEDLAGAISDLAVLAARTGRPDESAAAFGCAAGIRERTGKPDANMPERALYARVTSEVRALLGDDAFAAAWDRGHGWTMGEAQDEAERLLSEICQSLG